MSPTLARKLEAALDAEGGTPEKKPRVLTLLDLVAALADGAASETEVVGEVTRLINSGEVTLVGNFRGADVRVG